MSDSKKQNDGADTGSTAQSGAGDSARLWLLAIIATILTFAALKLAQSVVLPLVFALFMLAMTWPLRTWLGRWCRPAVASGLTFVAAILLVAVVILVLYFLFQRIVSAQEEYVPALVDLSKSVSDALERNGLPRLGKFFEEISIQDVITGLITSFYSFLGALLFIFILFLLGMPALEDLQRRVSRDDDGNGLEIGESFRKSAKSVQIYVAVTAATSAVTGILTGLICLLFGIDLALVWGGLAFLLNFIPTIGSILALIPPILMATLQFDTTGQILLAGLCLGAVQLVMGNYVHPKLAGRQVALRPVVILFSLALWGFIWGPVGALIAVPIMTTLSIFAANHDRTTWIAVILSQRQE